MNNQIFTLCAPTIMGVEGICADELRRIGFNNVRAEDGRVLFDGGFNEIASANLWCRTAERIQIQMGRFSADTFDGLFEGIKSIPWESVIPENGCFPVKAGHSIRSDLASIPSCQRIIKKAISVRLGDCYYRTVLPENGPEYPIQFTLIKNICTVCIDTTGASLHKRGYRREGSLAPIRETLAAAMIYFSRRRGDRTMIDPMCGSGTLAIEAAMIAGNIAPGLKRNFIFENFTGFSKQYYTQLKDKARQSVRTFDGPIFASDISAEMVALAKSNAMLAGVADRIHFSVGDMCRVSYPDNGLILTNPPYGERIGDAKESEKLLSALGRISGDNGLALVFISPADNAPQCVNRKADHIRKVYNGMIKCNLYDFRPDARLKK